MENAWQIVVRALMALLAGGLIGLEREVTDHPAGVRTHILVTIGSSIFTSVSVFGLANGGIDTRVAAGVVAGVGFIGAGAIIRGRGGLVEGLTTAASLWGCAAIGMLMGMGLFTVGMAVTGIQLLVLYIIDLAVELTLGRIKIKAGVLNFKGDYREGLLPEVLSTLEENHCRHDLIAYQRYKTEDYVDCTLKTSTSSRTDIEELTEEIGKIEGITEISWR